MPTTCMFTVFVDHLGAQYFLWNDRGHGLEAPTNVAPRLLRNRHFWPLHIPTTLYLLQSPSPERRHFLLPLRYVNMNTCVPTYPLALHRAKLWPSIRSALSPSFISEREVTTIGRVARWTLQEPKSRTSWGLLRHCFCLSSEVWLVARHRNQRA